MNSPSNQPNRFPAIDAMRGLTIALMILVNNPGSWQFVYPPFRHAAWHGCTPTDLVFPFFLFIMGVSMRFSFRSSNFTLDRSLARKILKRTVVIFLIGLMINAYPFIRQDWDWSSLRIMGVLQRIALCYGLAAYFCLKLGHKRIYFFSGLILLVYWLVLWTFGGSEPFALEQNLARQIDLVQLGEHHLWRGFGVPFDPEGLLATLPATITVVIGYLTGAHIQSPEEPKKLVVTMLKWGVGLVVIGWVWSFAFPLNKPLWSSSYVLFTGGWAILLFNSFYWTTVCRLWEKPLWPLVVFGTNSIFIFTASGLWAKTMLKLKYDWQGETVSGYSYLFKSVFQPLAGDYLGSLLFAIFHVVIWWLVLLWMYRQKIFIKI